MTDARKELITEPLDFEAGDRVVREFNVHDRSSPLMHGTVIEVERMENHYQTLFTVQWDHTTEPHRGYFWWGLRHEG